MAITVNWPASIITIPQSFLTYVSPGNYTLDVNAFRLALKDLEDNEDAAVWSDTHSHNTESTLSGVTYSRQFQILAPYTVTFEDVGTPYTVKCTGANHNIGDRKNVNQVSLIIGNSAGLITVTSGSGVTAQDKQDIISGVGARVVEGPLTEDQVLRVLLAALAGKRSGIGATTEQYFAVDGTTPRISFSPDVNGNGTPTVNGV